MTREVCEHFNPVDQPCAKCEEKRKSEALFLADELEIPLGTVIGSEVHRRAAAELRRLHAELERCKQVCAATSEAWREEAALAEPIEPVAWIHTDPDKRRVKFLEWRENEPGYRGDWIKTPLYAAPPQRKPLTEEELLKAVGWDIAEMYMKLTPNFPVAEVKKETLKNARAIERAHGIDGAPEERND